MVYAQQKKNHRRLLLLLLFLLPDIFISFSLLCTLYRQKKIFVSKNKHWQMYDDDGGQ